MRCFGFLIMIWLSARTACCDLNTLLGILLPPNILGISYLRATTRCFLDYIAVLHLFLLSSNGKQNAVPLNDFDVRFSLYVCCIGKFHFHAAGLLSLILYTYFCWCLVASNKTRYLKTTNKTPCSY